MASVGIGWDSFFAVQLGRGIRPVMSRLLELRGDEPPGMAVDLGCGDGTETRFLLASGWRVHAIDGEPGTQERVRSGVPREQSDRLTVEQTSFERLTAIPAADLVYSGFALPFCTAIAFPGLWDLVRASIARGGWFVGQLFGPHDSWSGRSDMNFHDRAQVEALLAGFRVLELTEDDRDGTSAMGPKHWHVFHIIARAR